VLSDDRRGSYSVLDKSRKVVEWKEGKRDKEIER